MQHDFILGYFLWCFCYFSTCVVVVLGGKAVHFPVCFYRRCSVLGFFSEKAFTPCTLWFSVYTRLVVNSSLVTCSRVSSIHVPANEPWAILNIHRLPKSVMLPPYRVWCRGMIQMCTNHSSKVSMLNGSISVCMSNWVSCSMSACMSIPGNSQIKT
jgi:hypothetical protein